jgi:hypothetical protein
MVRFYWYGLTVIYVACIAAGMLFGSVFGTAGMIVGIAFGATAAAGFAMFADKSEGRHDIERPAKDRSSTVEDTPSRDRGRSGAR